MPTKKKTSKSAKNKEKEMEKQVEILEKNIEKIETKKKKQTKAQREENKRKKEVEDKVDTIREDLQSQLLAQNKFGKQFDDMVEDYIFFVKLKEDLQHDIATNGLRYSTMTGNGFSTDKPNESVQNLVKINAQMLKILQDLDLKAPDEGPKEGEGDDLL